MPGWSKHNTRTINDEQFPIGRETNTRKLVGPMLSFGLNIDALLDKDVESIDDLEISISPTGKLAVIKGIHQGLKTYPRDI